MMIFIEKSLVFFATPKTGSTAFHQAMGHKAEMFFSKANAVKHISPTRFNKTFREFASTLAPNPLTTVAVMREPIEWLHSWYRYRSRDTLIGQPNSTADMSFDHFADAYLSDQRPDFANVGSQGQFLTGGTGVSLVDQLWSYTAINDLTLHLSLHLDHEFKLKQMNTSPKMAMVLSPDNQRALEKHFALDYTLYQNAIGNE